MEKIIRMRITIIKQSLGWTVVIRAICLRNAKLRSKGEGRRINEISFRPNFARYKGTLQHRRSTRTKSLCRLLSAGSSQLLRRYFTGGPRARGRRRVLNSHIVSWPLERAVGTVAVNGGGGGGGVEGRKGARSHVAGILYNFY